MRLPIADDTFVGTGTLVLAIATFVLAWLAFRQLKASHGERQLAEASLAMAQATLRAQQRPELVAFQRSGGTPREVHLASYGAVTKPEGSVLVAKELLANHVAAVSFEASNIGPGAAEITRLRLMSLDSQAEGAKYWEPHASDQILIVVPAGGIAPVDLVMTPPVPGWFYSNVDGGLKLWVEITYQDLGGVETYMRWFELRPHNYQPYPWYVAQVLRSPPPPFSNYPPTNPLIEPEPGSPEPRRE